MARPRGGFRRCPSGRAAGISWWPVDSWDALVSSKEARDDLASIDPRLVHARGVGGAVARGVARAESPRLQRGDRGPAAQPGTAQLAHAPGELRRLGLQPARTDHAR